MFSDVLAVGNKMKMTVVLSEEKKMELAGKEGLITKVFSTQIAAIDDNDKVTIDMPELEGKLIPLPLNSRFDITVYADSGIYKFRGVVVNRFKKGDSYYMTLEPMNELSKFQRRQYYRLECTFPIHYRMLNERELVLIERVPRRMREYMSDEEVKEGFSLDISGGGLRFVSDEQLEAGNYMLLNFSFMMKDSKTPFIVKAKLLSSRENMNGRRNYEQRVEFDDINEKVRETIIRFLFEVKQRESQKMDN